MLVNILFTAEMATMQPRLSAKKLEDLREAATQCCALLKAMAHEDRLLLLCQLAQGEQNVGELEERVGIRQPSLSQHLGVLREEGLVSARREGKYMYYSLASREVVRIMQTLSELYCAKPEERTA
jgi:DNA-binding transcriptional ArsR family regulator